MTDLDAALEEQFLNVPVAERKAVVQPNGVLNDEHGEAMAVRLDVGHSGSPYPKLVKATQPVSLPRSGSGNTTRSYGHDNFSLQHT